MSDSASGSSSLLRRVGPATMVVGLLMTAGCVLGHSPVRSDGSAHAHISEPPPAVSGIDDTVSVHWRLADSFDILPGDRCVGRGNNRGMFDGARVRLTGHTMGYAGETKATAYFEHFPPLMHLGRPLLDDDYLYCVVEAVFSPGIPEPDGYSVKFERARDDFWLGKPSGMPFGFRDRPGYGAYQITVQTCRSLLDPPDKDCPEWGN